MAEKKKVLVVDDHSDIVISIVNFLKYNGIEALQAYNWKDALEICKNDKPDLVMLDIMMPRMNGFEVAKKIPKQKILFMTAYDGLEEEAKDVKNSLGCIRKPIDLEELLKAIKKILKMK